jgi:hypothetical protein
MSCVDLTRNCVWMTIAANNAPRDRQYLLQSESKRFRSISRSLSGSSLSSSSSKSSKSKDWAAACSGGRSPQEFEPDPLFPRWVSLHDSRSARPATCLQHLLAAQASGESMSSSRARLERAIDTDFARRWVHRKSFFVITAPEQNPNASPQARALSESGDAHLGLLGPMMMLSLKRKVRLPRKEWQSASPCGGTFEAETNGQRETRSNSGPAMSLILFQVG